MPTRRKAAGNDQPPTVHGRSRPFRFGVAGVCVLVATLVRVALNPQWGKDFPYLAFFPAILLAALLGGWGPGLLAIALSVGAVVFFVLPPVGQAAVAASRDMGGLIGFVFVAGLIVWVADAQRQAQGKAEASADEARGAGEALQEALQKQSRIAETLQRSLLVSPPPGAFPGLEVAPYYEPAGDDMLLGGDFFDAFALGSGRVALVVGDVTGKGLSAASHTAEVKYTLRGFLREHQTPAAALRRLNAYLLDSQQLDPERDASLVTVAVAVVEVAHGRVTMAAGGAEAPLIVWADGGTEEVAAGGPVIGATPDAEYPEQTRRLAPGDMLVLVTDGITEARHGRHEFFGSEGLIRSLQVLKPGETPLSEIGRKIATDARQFAGGTLKDDVCLLLARPHGPSMAPRAPGMDAGKVHMAPDFDDPIPDGLTDAFGGG